MRALLFIAVVSKIIYHHHGVTHAMPANPMPLSVFQPDGITETPPLTFHGNERYHYYTDDLGYTVIRDPSSGWYVYATLDPKSGDLRSSGANVGQVDPTTLGIPTRVRPDDSFIQNLGPMPGEYDEGDETPSYEGNNTEGYNSRRRMRYSGTVDNPFTLKALCILICFKDHCPGRPLPTRSSYEVLIDQPGGGLSATTGSVRDVFFENSYGKFDMNCHVTEWIPLPCTEIECSNKNWGWEDNYIRIHGFKYALDQLVKKNFDFTPFDQNNNKVIDSLMFVHSGIGSESGHEDCDKPGVDSINRVWSAKSTFRNSGVTWTDPKSGIRAEPYYIGSGVWPKWDRSKKCYEYSGIAHIGVIAHELGHDIGLADLYDDVQGLGNFDMMANAWDRTGTQKYPPHLTPHNKYLMGWMNKIPIIHEGIYTLNPSGDDDTMFVIEEGFAPGEYLILENCHPTGLHVRGGPSPHIKGLCLWHIDSEARTFCKNKPRIGCRSSPTDADWPKRHYRNALLSADGLYQLEKGINHGDIDDAFRIGSTAGISQNGIVVNGVTKPYPNTHGYRNGFLKPTGLTIEVVAMDSPNPTQIQVRVSGGSLLPELKLITQTPTQLPTSSPTKQPTKSPTKQPTNSPTKSPIRSPTKQPTITLTNKPTNKPVMILNAQILDTENARGGDNLDPGTCSYENRFSCNPDSRFQCRYTKGGRKKRDKFSCVDIKTCLGKNRPCKENSECCRGECKYNGKCK